MNNSVVAIMLGRKGSKGMPGKNTISILGRPAFHYPILAAKNSRYVNQIYVSTDDEMIIDDCKPLGVEVITRPDWLCTDKALFDDALVHAYQEVKNRICDTPKYIVALMANAVTINAELIDLAIDMLEKDPEADSAVTVSIFNMYSPLRARKLNKKGYLQPFVPLEVLGDPNLLSCDRESQGDAYFADMSHSVCRSEALENIEKGLLPQRWMGNKILPVLNGCGCDIDEAWQLDMSIHWLLGHGFSEEQMRNEK